MGQETKVTTSKQLKILNNQMFLSHVNLSVSMKKGKESISVFTQKKHMMCSP